MSGTSQPTSFYIGWDVGGWNCDKNGKSRDAIVILDSERRIVGSPWRGNLRQSINQAATSAEWIDSLFSLCDASSLVGHMQLIIGIDTPLGFSDAFARLVTGLECEPLVGDSETNPYLFRQTEHFLFQQGLKPLSAIKDMIGSQATKGMHVLAKFAPKGVSCGVWSDGAVLTAIEAYPSVCKGSATMRSLRHGYPALGHEDEDDALACALLAYLYAEQPGKLAWPSENVSSREGWIWVPKDVLK